MNEHVDVLLVTVTEIESRSVLQVFQEQTGLESKIVPLEDKTYHDLGVLNGAHVWHALSGMGPDGLDGSLQAVSKAIMALRPKAVVMVGVAFGLNAPKQAIGDILVSETLRLYELQRVGIEAARPNIILRGSRPDASPWLLDCLRNARLHWDAAPVHFGVLLTGQKLVDNLDLREHLRSFEPEAIGGEMEGAGLYAACQAAKVDWILVKAICDWADGHKSVNRARRQKLAARNAAHFVLHALTGIGLKRDASFSGLWKGGFRLQSIQHSVCAVIWAEDRRMRCAMTVAYTFNGAVTVVVERFSCEVAGDTITLVGYDWSFLIEGNEGNYRLDAFRLVLAADGTTLNDAAGESGISLRRTN